MPKTFEVEITTSTHLNGTIQQDIHHAGQRIATQVLQTQDAQVQEALIKLGWTPPAGKQGNNAMSYLKELVKALDSAYISSWQSTAKWQEELDEAREFISEFE